MQQMQLNRLDCDHTANVLCIRIQTKCQRIFFVSSVYVHVNSGHGVARIMYAKGATDNRVAENDGCVCLYGLPPYAREKIDFFLFSRGLVYVCMLA